MIITRSSPRSRAAAIAARDHRAGQPVAAVAARRCRPPRPGRPRRCRAAGSRRRARRRARRGRSARRARAERCRRRSRRGRAPRPRSCSRRTSASISAAHGLEAGLPHLGVRRRRARRRRAAASRRARSAVQPAADEARRPARPRRCWTSILRWRSPAGACSRSASAISSSAPTAPASSTTSRLRSHFVGCAGVKTATPCANGSARAVDAARSAPGGTPAGARAQSSSSSSPPPARLITIWSSSIVTSTGRWPGPVLGVDGVVLDRGVEPQAVALLAVVEGALERPGALAACGRGGRRRRGAGFFSVVVLVLVLVGGALGGLLGELGLLLGAAGLLGLELRGDGGVVLGAEVDLLGGAGGSSPSASSSFSRLKDWICCTVTSSWWAIQASVRPCRTHPRI